MKKKALIVEDIEMNREILAEMLEDDYEVLEAEDGVEALKVMNAHTDEISVVLLDLIMPKMGGVEVLERIRGTALADRFPVLIITGETAPEIEEKCLELGAHDFIKKPYNPVTVRHRVKNAESLHTYKRNLEDKVSEQTARLREQNARLELMNEKTIELLSNVVEARNLESGTHVRRVKGFTRILAEKVMERIPRYGLDEHTVKMMSLASSMHDVGKIMISDTVLLKPGKLTKDEFEYMKTHTVCGCSVLETSKHMWEDDYYQLCWQICRYHHEKWDGRGYPEGLKGDEIPISAQIVAVADCYDALTTERVYKAAFSADEAFRMITNGECGAFNPELMECFSECRGSFMAFAAECSN